MERQRDQFELNLETTHCLPHPIHYGFADAFMSHYENNNFYHAVANRVGNGITHKQFHRYHIGTVKDPEGGTAALLSESPNPYHGYCDGLIYLCDPDTGRSLLPYVDYVSDRLFELHNVDILSQADRRIFIGEALAHSSPEKPVAVVYSMIDAVLADHFLPQYTWLAIGECREALFTNANLLRRLPSDSICFLSHGLDAPEWISTIQLLLSAGCGTKKLTHIRLEGDFTESICNNSKIIHRQLNLKQ